MTKKFDLVAIGTGTAASTVAEASRAAGWEVAIVDSKPFGGTCQLRGCDPKKVLVGASEVIDWARRMTGKGINGEAVRIQWPELMRFKRTFTDPAPKQREETFAKEGIATFHGRARFIGPTAIQVGDQTLEARYIAVAAGATPAKLKIPGEELITTSEQFLELDALPRRIVFVGGGYISFEFAHVAARAGAQVTILHRGSRVLAGFDPDLVDLLAQATHEIGVDIRLNAVVDGVEKVSSGLVVSASAAGQNSAFETDMAVHGAGRVPDIEDMCLDVAGVEWNERRGVKVNEYLQSVSNSAVYAAGDCAASGGLPLTSVAGYEGRIVADNLLKGNHAKPDYLGVPTVVFTTPPLAAVGLQERNAREQGLRFRINYANTSGWYSSRRIAERYSGYKVLIEEGMDRIIGAHLLGSASEELINIFALAIRSRMPATALRAAIFAYPTHGSNLSYMLE